MKILITAWKFAPDIGGSERLTELLARGFADRGHEVRVVTHSLSKGRDSTFPFEVVRRPDMTAYRVLCRWADVNMFVSIHLKWIGYALWACRNVVVQHNYDYAAALDVGKPLRGQLKYVIARWLPGIAVSTFLQQKTRAADLLSNPYDEDAFYRRLSWSERTRDVLFLGRLIDAKGGHILLKALSEISENLVSTTIAGEGPVRSQMEAQAKAYDLADTVHFLGTVSPDDVPALMNTHRIVVVPSLVAEGFGLVAIEALASGCAVIASDIGGLPDAVGSHGRLFPMGDSAALARQIEAVLGYEDTPPPELADVESHLVTMHKGAVIDRYLDVLERYAKP